MRELPNKNEVMIEELKKISDKESCKAIVHQIQMSSARINELIRSIVMETDKINSLLAKFVQAI